MKRNNITKNNILENIKYDLGIPDTFAKKIFNNFMDIILEGLNRDGKVKLSNFGTFKVLNKKARLGRNPKTKETYEISSRKVVVFSPSSLVQKKINDKK